MAVENEKTASMLALVAMAGVLVSMLKVMVIVSPTPYTVSISSGSSATRLTIWGMVPAQSPVSAGEMDVDAELAPDASFTLAPALTVTVVLWFC